MLYAIHTLLTFRDDIVREMEESTLHVLKLLVNVHKEFSNKRFEFGKYLWLKQFKFQTAHQWDSYGTEEQFFFCKFKELLCTTHITECMSVQCLVPVILKTSSLSYL